MPPFENPMTTAGDLIRGGASGAPTRVGIGSEGQILRVVSGVPTWEDPPEPEDFTELLAISNVTNAPFIRAYGRRPGGDIEALVVRSTGTAAVQNCAWAPNGVHLIAAGASGFGSLLFKRTGRVVASTSGLPVTGFNLDYSCAWSHDSAYAAIGAAAAELFIFSRAGDAMTNVNATFDTAPPNANVTGVAWSPDGTKLAVASAGSPYLLVYDWYPNGDGPGGKHLVKWSNPATLPAGAAYAVCWHPSGNAIVVAHDTSPNFSVYTISGSTLTKVANPADLPANSGRSCQWSHDGSFMLIGTAGASNNVLRYSWDGAALVRESVITKPVSGAQCWGLGMNADSTLVCRTHSGSQSTYLAQSLMEWSGTTPVDLTDGNLPGFVSTNIQQNSGNQASFCPPCVPGSR